MGRYIQFTAFSIFSMTLLSGCSGSAVPAAGTTSATTASTGTTSTSTTTSTTATGSTAISAFSPLAGTVSVEPTTIQVTFSAYMDPTTTQNVTNWSWDCYGTVYAVTAVSLNGATATVTLPSVSNVSNGESCVLTASYNIQDQNLNYITGARTATYTLSNGTSTGTTTTGTGGAVGTLSGALVSPYANDRIYGNVTVSANAYDSGGTIEYVKFYMDSTLIGTVSSSPWQVTFDSTQYTIGSHTLSFTITENGASESGTIDSRAVNVQNYYTGYSSAVGGSGGNIFQVLAPSGYNMMGLQLTVGSMVSTVSALWETAWGAAQTSQSATYGSSGSSSANLACPSGYRVMGLYGQSGSKIDALGVVCQMQNTTGQTQTYTYYSGEYGGSGGNYFEADCPSPTFAVGLNGQSGSVIDELQLVCR